MLTAAPGQAAKDETLEILRHHLDKVGIHFLSVKDDYVHLDLHGHARKPVRTRQLGEMLLEIRGKWLH